MENNGHTIEVIPTDPQKNSVTLNETRYFLQQFHFHASSEHLIDGKPTAAELHLVHKAADGSLLVVGVLLETGAASAELAEVFDTLPRAVSDEAAPLTQKIDPFALLPDHALSVQYDGSLTTPPCSEGVRWNVFLTPSTVSAEQLRAFTAIYSANHRPVQPLHDRSLTLVGDSAK